MHQYSPTNAHIISMPLDNPKSVFISLLPLIQFRDFDKLVKRIITIQFVYCIINKSNSPCYSYAITMIIMQNRNLIAYCHKIGHKIIVIFFQSFFSVFH